MMLTPIGEMREVVAILTPIAGTDSAGGQSTTWVAGDPLFVALRSPTSREAVQFGQTNADISHVIFGHWHDLNALVSDTRLRNLETDIEYEVVGLPQNDPKRAWSRLNVIHRENG